MASTSSNNYDSIIVGGGLVGSAVACGIAATGARVAVLDGGDRDFRASRGNFGLVWVQGKGAEFPAYAKLSAAAAGQWADFAAELHEATGIDVDLQQTGGYDFCLTQQEWDDRNWEMQQVHAHTAGNFEYQMLDQAELAAHIPQVAEDVLGASYSPQDGHVNPLYLLRALHQTLASQGVAYLAGEALQSTQKEADRFLLSTQKQVYRCERVIYCAGLSNQRLCSDLDMHIPVHPLRGQLLITDRVEAFLPAATLQVRQTAEGTLQIGDSHEDVGLDESTTLEVITRLARRAVRIFPHLAGLRLNRAWGALRIMTPDGAPVYHRSQAHPGAYAISCHSGVTLAALHAREIAHWICADTPDPLIEQFSADRFDV